MNRDEQYMRMAMELAWGGIGRNSPNPLVGCVIVRDDKIIGKGFHLYEKLDHAEIAAMKNAGGEISGSTVYVTLEPCVHFGRTPPCADALVSAGVKRVVYGMRDPHPRVDGQGHEFLEKNGIEVVGGILENEIRRQNRFFVTVHEKNRPFVLLKWAMSADGKIATSTLDSRGISGKESTNLVHHLRNIYDAILVGHNTVLTDNPSLTCRVDLTEKLPQIIFPVSPSDIRNPLRIILDTFCSIFHHDLNLFSLPGKTIVAAAPEGNYDDPEIRDRMNNPNIEILECELKAGRVDLNYLLTKLVGMGINSILVEGGSEVHAAFINERLVDEFLIIISPKIIGGDSAVSPVGGKGIDKISDAVQLKNMIHFQIGDDIILLAST